MCLLIASCAQTGRIKTESKCSAHYAEHILPPLVFPEEIVRLKRDSSVSYEVIGSAEDPVSMEVNSLAYRDGLEFNLKPGKNAVDFVVRGEGEVHYWHIALKANGEKIFEHKQGRLPAFSCDDELYRYRMLFYVE